MESGAKPSFMLFSIRQYEDGLSIQAQGKLRAGSLHHLFIFLWQNAAGGVEKRAVRREKAMGLFEKRTLQSEMGIEVFFSQPMACFGTFVQNPAIRARWVDHHKVE